MVLPLEEVDWERLDQSRRAVEADGFSLVTLASELGSDAESNAKALEKFVDLVNSTSVPRAQAKGMNAEVFTLERMQEVMAKTSLKPAGSTLYIARKGDVYAASAWLRNLDEEERRIEVGIPLVRDGDRTVELAAALHLHALESARDRGLESVHSFVDDRDADIMAACEATGFGRRLVMPIYEKQISD